MTCEQLMELGYKQLHTNSGEVFDTVWLLKKEAARSKNTYFSLEAEYLNIAAIIRIEKQSIIGIEKALELIKITKDHFFLTRIYNLIGITYKNLFNFEQAKIYFTQGISLLELYKKNDTQYNNLLGNLHYNLQLCISEYDIAKPDIYHIEYAISCFKEISNKNSIAESYNLLSKIYTQINQYEKAAAFLLLSIELLEEIKDDSNLIKYYSNLSLIYAKLNQRLECEKYIRLTQKLLPANINEPYRAGFHMNKVEIYLLFNDFKKAVSNLKAAEKLFLKNKDKIGIEKVYLLYAKIFEKTADFEKAFEYQKKYTLLIEEQHEKNIERIKNNLNYEIEITVRKKEADALRAKNTAIEEYVKKLNKSYKNLEFFSHIVSHDIQEPIRMISIYSGLLEMKTANKLDEKEKQDLHFIRNGAIRLSNLIKDLVIFNTLQKEAPLEECSIIGTINETIENLSIQITERNATIILPETDAIVFFTKSKLIQLLQNIISNAIKYNPKKNPTVQITLTTNEEEVSIHIADNGKGIDKSQRENAFKIFNRLDQEGKSSGSGLGLAICKKIIDDADGKIWIEESDMGGAMFCFTIPHPHQKLV